MFLPLSAFFAFNLLLSFNETFKKFQQLWLLQVEWEPFSYHIISLQNYLLL